MSMTVRKLLVRVGGPVVIVAALAALGTMSSVVHAQAQLAGQAAAAAGPDTSGEANLVLPDLASVKFQGVDGHTLLMSGLVVCVLGLVFGLVTFTGLKNLPVHSSMLE